MSLFTDIMVDVSQSINEIFGELCALYVIDPYNENADLLLPSINVIVDKGKKVKNEFNSVIGYRTAVKILRSDLPMPPKGDAYLQTANGEVYILGEVTEQNNTAYWLDAAISSDEFPELP